MVDKELISRKISNLSDYIACLEKAEDINWEKYKSDDRSRAFVERYLHLSIEEMFDIANFPEYGILQKYAGSPL